MLLPGVIVFFIFNTDNFVLGAIKGAEQLGYYAIAFTWGSMICVLLSGSLHKVLFPTFSKLQHDRTAMKKAYLTSLHYIAFLAVPANLLLALEARGFLLWILGQGSDRWLPALLTFQILCVYGIFRALLEPTSNVILGLGKPQLFLRAIMLVALLQLSLLYPAITFFGMEGVAVTVTIAYLSQYSIYIPIMNRELNVTASELFGEICSTVAAAAVMSIVILAMKLFTVFSLTTTVVETGLGFLLYLSVFGMMDRGKLYREAWTLAQAHP
jgi:O-antigen/teichoic acid export membrane protein